MGDGPEPEEGGALVLATVTLAVFLATTPWFTGTAVVPAVSEAWDLGPVQGAWLTSATQYGFIAGTLLYAVTNVADRFNARRVFFVSASLAALFNLGFGWAAQGYAAGLVFRTLTGVVLAGVYPVGMKIVASWYRGGLGWRLGVMIGGLTAGTAAPYLLRAVTHGADWRVVISLASGMALAGGLLMALGLGDGPFLRGSARFDVRAAFRSFREPGFRRTNIAYFGHMWELYAFWALAGSYLGAALADDGPQWFDRVSTLSFAAVAIGCVGAVLGGLASRRVGERNVAAASLAMSGACCLASPFAFQLPPPALIAFVLVWGLAVIADSAQFSALVTNYCDPVYTGTALTVMNGIGMFITVLTIQGVPRLAGAVGWQYAMAALALGPVVGLVVALRLPATR